MFLVIVLTVIGLQFVRLRPVYSKVFIKEKFKHDQKHVTKPKTSQKTLSKTIVHKPVLSVGKYQKEPRYTTRIKQSNKNIKKFFCIY